MMAWKQRTFVKYFKHCQIIKISFKPFSCFKCLNQNVNIEKYLKLGWQIYKDAADNKQLIVYK